MAPRVPRLLSPSVLWTLPLDGTFVQSFWQTLCLPPCYTHPDWAMASRPSTGPQYTKKRGGARRRTRRRPSCDTSNPCYPHHHPRFQPHANVRTTNNLTDPPLPLCAQHFQRPVLYNSGPSSLPLKRRRPLHLNGYQPCVACNIVLPTAHFSLEQRRERVPRLTRRGSGSRCMTCIIIHDLYITNHNPWGPIHHSARPRENLLSRGRPGPWTDGFLLIVPCTGRRVPATYSVRATFPGTVTNSRSYWNPNLLASPQKSTQTRATPPVGTITHDIMTYPSSYY